uniref:Uncharacterized protein n=1 Tax=viral metagenome TaxID=1070528 RepID=A0A6C0J718_9ZZZZ
MDDQTHGTRVKTEEFVITSIGEKLMLDINNCNNMGRNPLTFCEHLNHKKLHQLCLKYNMPVTSIWSINNPRVFMNALKKQRDTMTLTSLYSLIKDYDDIIDTYHGTCDHSDVLGDVLEGLVIWTDDKIIKLKLPEYTHRTFCYRSWINKFKPAEYAFRSSNINNFIEHLDTYLKYWVVTNEGRDYWKQKILMQLLTLNNNNKLIPILNTDDLVKNHIIIAETTDIDINTDIDTVYNNFMDSFKSSKQLHINIVVFLGPIGVGKSSRAKQLCENNPIFEHIDGDILGHSLQEVLQMKQERNPYTKSCLIKCILNKHIPVISTGEGALTGINETIESITGLIPKMHLFLPCEQHLLNKFYKEWDISDIITERVHNKIWSCPPVIKLSDFIKQIASLSTKNVKFATQFTKTCNKVYTFPIITNYTTDIKCLDWIPKLSITNTVIDNIKIYSRQLRLMTKVFNLDNTFYMGHITIFFSKTRKKINIDWFNNLLTLCGEYNGTKYNTVNWEFIHVPLNTDITRLDPDATHITIRSEKHYPYDMRSACKQINDKKNTIILPTKKNSNIDYKIEQITSKQVKVFMID